MNAAFNRAWLCEQASEFLPPRLGSGSRLMAGTRGLRAAPPYFAFSSAILFSVSTAARSTVISGFLRQ